MHSKATVFVASLAALMITAACGENRPPAAPSPVSNPTDPAPNPPAPNPPTPNPNPPAPTPNPPTPTPNPPAPTPSEPFAFTPDTTAPASHSYSLQPDSMVEDDIYVALYANDFGGMNGVNTINMVRATIGYDPAVVTPVSFSSAGSWMESFGHQATFKVTKSGSNLIKVTVDSNDSFDGASGSGTVLRLRFRRVGPGSSRLEFTEAHAYGASYNDNLKATHGGTLIVK